MNKKIFLVWESECPDKYCHDHRFLRGVFDSVSDADEMVARDPRNRYVEAWIEKDGEYHPQGEDEEETPMIVSPPILKPPDELRRLGESEAIIRLSEQQYRDWARAPHCCGARGFEPAEGHRCPACERDAAKR